MHMRSKAIWQLLIGVRDCGMFLLQETIKEAERGEKDKVTYGE